MASVKRGQKKFQSTHPRGVRRGSTCSTWMLPWFQSTHPRGVRQVGVLEGAMHTDVSIHAPAWGATGLAGQVIVDIAVSIHAPAWGATSASENHLGRESWFQSTHPRGVRLDAAAHLRHQLLVSIHAPAWGATAASTAARAIRPCFNPRTRVGCDDKSQEADRKRILFQSTHPRGVRPFDAEDKAISAWVSIHAPAWGATGHGPRFLRLAGVSIHAPAWGATPAPAAPPHRGSCFNPRTRVGCDRRASRILPGRWCFNPRTRVGCDSRVTLQSSWMLLFQSTHPRGVRLPLPCPCPSPIIMFQSTHPRGVRLFPCFIQ